MTSASPSTSQPRRRCVSAALVAVACLGTVGLCVGPAAAAPSGTATALAPRSAPALLPAVRATPRPFQRVVARTPASLAAATGPALAVGGSLTGGQSIVSPSGRYSLVMGTDGTLTYQDAPNRLNGSPVSQLAAHGPAGSHLDLQTDGNLVLSGPDGTVARSYGTAGSGAQQLLIQDDANLVLYGMAGAVVIDFAPRATSLVAGQALLPGDRVLDHDGTELVMQTDGNLVLYRGGAVLFSASTFANPGAAAILQTDGNVVVYSDATPAVPLFSTATSNATGSGTTLEVFQGEFKVFLPDSTTVYGSDWGSATVAPGQALFRGDRRVSPGGACRLILQTDGNLVDYCGAGVAFTTNGSGVTFGVMFEGGNFQQLASDGAGGFTLVFATGTSTPRSRLVVQDDRNLVVYTPQNRPVFSIR